VTGIAERVIRQAAEWWGTARTSFLLHARGIEHHSHGVQNVLGAINIVLVSALATVSAFIYNVSADLAGGLEVTLSERE
jgi:hypothetical protein